VDKKSKGLVGKKLGPPRVVNAGDFMEYAGLVLHHRQRRFLMDSWRLPAQSF
jgi:hypothetical protein